MISPKSFNISRVTFFFAKEKSLQKWGHSALQIAPQRAHISKRVYSIVSVVKFACESKENTAAHLAEQSINSHNTVQKP